MMQTIRQGDIETERQTERRTYKLDWTTLGYYKSQFKVINESQRSIPTLLVIIVIVIVIISLVIKLLITNKKSQKTRGRQDGRTEIRTYYTSTQVVLPHGLRTHVLHIVMGCAFLYKKMDAEYPIERQRDR